MIKSTGVKIDEFFAELAKTHLDKEHKTQIIDKLDTIFGFEEIMQIQNTLLNRNHLRMLAENKTKQHELEDMSFSYKPCSKGELMLPGDMYWIKYRWKSNEKDVVKFLQKYKDKSFDISWIQSFYPWFEDVLKELKMTHLIDYEK